MSKEFSPYRVKKIETAQYQIERVSRVEHFPDVESLEVNYDIHVHEKETQKEFNIQEKHLVKYHNPDAVADLFETCGLKVLEMGPYFDEATSIDQAWNCYLLAKDP